MKTENYYGSCYSNVPQSLGEILTFVLNSNSPLAISYHKWKEEISKKQLNDNDYGREY